MSQQIFIMFIAAIGLLGGAVALHLIFFGKNIMTSKMLGWYTILLTISSLEPLKEYFGKATYLFEIMVAVGSFLIGPVLFLYCKHRMLNRMKWERNNVLHFIPAALLLTLIILTPQANPPPEESIADVLLYLLFIAQAFAYLLVSLILTRKHKKRGNAGVQLHKFHFTFTLSLALSSLVLFVYSFGSTLLDMNTSFGFTLSIQAFLTLIIIVIVLLNAETLENHEIVRTLR